MPIASVWSVCSAGALALVIVLQLYVLDDPTLFLRSVHRYVADKDAARPASRVEALVEATRPGGFAVTAVNASQSTSSDTSSSHDTYSTTAQPALTAHAPAREPTKPPKAVKLPAALAGAPMLDTRPVHRPALDPHARYLAYRPHSGFHNQRIALSNALVLAHLTKRTLLVPLARLGTTAVTIIPTAHRLKSLAAEDKDKRLDCVRQLPELEEAAAKSDKIDRKSKCGDYVRYSEIGWDTLVDLSRVEHLVKLVDRTDTSREWMTAKDGLNVPEDQIVTFDSKFGENPTNLRYEEDGESEPLGRYRGRMTLSRLNRAPIADKQLLFLGSLFAEDRVLGQSPEFERARQAVSEAMVFRNPILLDILDEVVDHLGGTDSFISLHLRTRDGGFLWDSRNKMEDLFRRLMIKTMHLDEARTDALLAAASSRPPSSPQSARPTGLTTELRCGQKLYTEPELQILNTPVYIATDARDPRSHPHPQLQLFFRTLPCAFTLDDFSQSVASPYSSAYVKGLDDLRDVRNAQDGVRLAPYLHGFLDAMIAARTRIGFVGCVESVLKH